MRPRVQWTAEADAYLRANYMTTSNAKLAKHFGISQPTLQRHLREINIDGNKVGKTRWTIEDKALVTGVLKRVVDKPAKPKRDPKIQRINTRFTSTRSLPKGPAHPRVEGHYFLSEISPKVAERLKEYGIVASTYAEAFDILATKGIHPFVRPWQLTDKRYFEGRWVDQFGALHGSDDAPTWWGAADNCLIYCLTTLRKIGGDK